MKRILNTRLPLIVNSPAKVFDLNYFKTISNSGGLPLFDSEYFDDKDNIGFLNQLKDSDFLFAIKIPATNQKLITLLDKVNIPNLDLIIFSYAKPEELDSINFRNSFYKTCIEIKDIEINDKIEKLDVNFLILKGYEAKGNVSKYTSYILMQWYIENSKYPLFIYGGVGMHTAAGMFAAGVCGIVLDDQLYLCDEAPVAVDFKNLISKIDEKDTIVIGEYIDNRYRVFSKLGTVITKNIREKESIAYLNNASEERRAKSDDGINSNFKLEEEIKKNLTQINLPNSNPVQCLFFLGQDAYFAKYFIKGSKNVKDVIYNFFKTTGENLDFVDNFDPLTENSPLTLDHVTKYPIIQGPMGNISDTADFALKIFENGGLPFFAMGNLPANIAENILSEGNKKLDNFGAGLIGLNYNKPLASHIELIKKHKVKFAIVAGGVPAQVNELEARGIKAYLHAPSMQLLENAIKNCTAHRFIFEGTEAGGHVGSLTSLVLWELAIEKLINQNNAAIKKQSIIFAGGISSSSGSAFISGMSSRIASMGAKIGISIGTSYLFTKEIVETKALMQLYQDVLKEKKDSVVIANTIGLPTRTVLTPYAEDALVNEHKWIKERTDLQERKAKFETFNSGSLLIAAKAFSPNFDKKLKTDPEYLFYDKDDQFKRGNFMTGDSLAFYSNQISIADIHNTLFHTKESLYKNLNSLEALTHEDCEINDEIAITGMAGIYPDAKNTIEFWENIISKKYSITQVPDDRFDSALYYDKDHKAEDKSYSRLAGVIKDFNFDYQRFGYTEKEAKIISRSQKMILQTAMDAVEDAGYIKNKKLIGKRTSVIVGNYLGQEYSDRNFKYFYPEIIYYLEQIDAYRNLDTEKKNKILDSIKQSLCKPDLSEDLEHVLGNIDASRIARHLDIEGSNFSVDGACASSLIALDCALKSLLSNENDVIIAGGVSTSFSPELFVGFCKMNGLSDDGSFPFDERANGFILGEGAGVVVLKRVKDAIRDGDRIHAIIKGIGTSSDGKGKAIAAPNPEGQGLALTRCFEKMKTSVSFDDIDYIEAHGTSTLAGDAAEMQTLNTIYKTNHPIGISSVKSQIGHLLTGAGMAGITKAVLAIQHKTLPPNGQFKKLSANINLKAPFYVIENPADWKIEKGKARKAAISSFGFGGINTHIVVEEFNQEYQKLSRNIFNNPDYDFNDNRIVIIGTGCLLPDAFDTETYWNNLASGKVSLYDIPENRIHNEFYSKQEDKKFNIPKIKAGLIKDYKFNGMKFKLPPATIKLIDKTQLYTLEAAYQAIEQANLRPTLCNNGNKVGVVMGNTMLNENFYEIGARVRIPLIAKSIDSIEEINKSTKNDLIEKLTSSIRTRFPKSTEDTFPGYIANLISGRIANQFNCNGVNFEVDSASTASADAISLAIKGLKNNDYDFAITGGVDCNFTPSTLKGLQQMGMLSTTGNSVFDKDSNGIYPAEGGIVFIITKYKNAVANKMKVLAELNDLSLSTHKSDTMLTSPNKTAYSLAINNFYSNSSIKPSQIKYLEIYGVGNVLFDLMELQVISKKFNNDLYFGSIKNNFGYLKSAHPAAVLLKLVLMCNHRKVLVNNINQENSIVDNNSVLKFNNQIIDIGENENQYFATNIFGIGGNHGHCVVSSLPLFLNQVSGIKTQSLNYNTNTEKNNQKEETISLSTDNGKQKTIKAAVLLSGQGSQYIGMMKELYNSDNFFHAFLDSGEKIFREIKGYSLLDIMFNDADKLILTENTQPAIFMSSAAIYDYLKKHQFHPDYYIGHSLGEFTALYCSGMLDFEQAMKLVIKRAELMQEAANQNPGSMVAVFKDESETENLVKKSGIQNIYVANKNCEEQTVVSGENQGIADFILYLKEQKITNSKVNVATAFHTPYFLNASLKLKDYLENVKFNNAALSKVFSNVTGEQYPDNEKSIKELLSRQMVYPVEFVKTIKNAANSGAGYFIEAGPNKILVNLIKKINISTNLCQTSIDPKIGEKKSLDNLIENLIKINLIKELKDEEPARQIKEKINPIDIKIDSMNRENKESAISSEREMIFNKTTEKDMESLINFSKFNINSTEFAEYIEEKKDEISKLLYDNYIKFKNEKFIDDQKNLGLFSGNIVISGVSVGLPGSGYKVFDSENFNRVLAGMNFIEALSEQDKEKIADKHITRLNKAADGNAKFQTINKTDDVIQLAAKLGYFNLKKDYGIDYNYDISYSLAIAAGIEALKDAGIPLVMQYKKTSTGGLLPEGYALPLEMQERTGLIFSSVLSGYESMIDEITKYYTDKFLNRPFNEFENIYFYIMENIKDVEIKRSVTDWYNNLKTQTNKTEPYTFNRNLLLDISSLGATHFAQIIKAKGPNTQISATCTTTTQAIGIGDDWIRTGRCDRVIIIGGESATSNLQQEWLGASFLSVGAATDERLITDAAVPFDERRNGLILGSAAVSLIIEKEEEVHKRGINGQARILGTYIGNSAHHASRIDTKYFSSEMKKFFDKCEKLHNLKKDSYTKSLLFMSHESYTTANGGPANSEVAALKHSFPEHFKNITITNIKGLTGSTLGASTEDAVMVKALQKGKAPSVPNLKQIPDEFKEMKFCDGKDAEYEYAVHLAAGFGSYLSFLFIKKLVENPTENNEKYIDWLKKISNKSNPELTIINNTLCIKNEEQKAKIEENKEIKVKPVSKPIHEPVKEPVFVNQKQEIKIEKEEEIKPTVIILKPELQNVSEDIKTIIAEQTGYTTDMLEDNLDLEADLGIDTVKQVEIFGKITAKFNLDVPENLKLNQYNTISKIVDFVNEISENNINQKSEVIIQKSEIREEVITENTNLDTQNVSDDIKSIIAEQTGYTTDMLEDNLDLEADLGIDTVKQVEIFGKITAKFNLDVPENLKLNQYNTISKIVGFVNDISGNIASQKPEAESRKPEVVIQKTEIKEEVRAENINPDTQNVSDEVKSIIAEQTGYSTDMLEDNLDLEADLGIDTVKQVEIFGKITAKFNLDVPENLKLNQYSTIAKIVEFVNEISGNNIKEQPAIINEPEIKVTKKETEVVQNYSEKETEEQSDTSYISEQIIPMNGNVAKEIKKIISELTDSKVEMLGDDMDLESDLGIDSVKRAQICSKVSLKFKFTIPDNFKISELKTITNIADFVKKRVADVHSTKNTSSPETSYSKKITDFNPNIKRFIIEAIGVDKDNSKQNIFKGKTFLITTDKFGFAEEMVKQIHSYDGDTITIGLNENDNLKIDLSNPEKIESEIDNISKKIKNINGVIHFSPLDSYFEPASDRDQINTGVKSIFLIIKTLFEYLNKKESLFASISFNSIVFPYTDQSIDTHPVFAGISGLLKSVHKEIPESIVKIVDFNNDRPLENINEIINTYVSELMSKDSRVETGYSNGNKYAIKLSEKAITQENESFIKKGSTILITGGGKGITYEIAKSLIKEYETNLLILDKTNLSSIDSRYINEVSDEKIIFEELKTKMKGSKPVEIKNALNNILNVRETISNIAYLKTLGTEIYYETVDVCDFSSINLIAQNYTNIDGIIHAAGLEESNLIPKKEFSTFNKIFDVKVYGALNVLNAFNKHDYKFFITFSSVAAKFGNEGQVDYAAANDMLCKIVLKEKQNNSDKIYKVYNWTAWIGTGMATKESVLKVLTESKLDFLEIPQGVKFFMDELKESETTEVVVTGTNDKLDIDKIFYTKAIEKTLNPMHLHNIHNDFCFIDSIIQKDEKSCESLYTFSLDRDYYLQSHYYGGNPFVPGTFIAEILIQNSKILVPFMNFIRFYDFNIFNVVKLPNNQDKLVKVISEIIDNRNEITIISTKLVSDILNFNGEIIEKDKLHYECKIAFSKNKSKIYIGEYQDIDYKILIQNSEFKVQNSELFYHPTLLYMGPKLRTINNLLLMTKNMAIAELKYNDTEIFTNCQRSSFTIDPVFFEGCLQLAVLILGINYKYIGTLANIGGVEIYDKIDKNNKYYCVAYLKTDGFKKDDKSFLFDIILYNDKWQSVMFIKDFKGFISLDVDKDLLTKINSEFGITAESQKSDVVSQKPEVRTQASDFTRFPFLDKKGEESKTDNKNALQFSRILDLKRDLFFLHHTKADIPIFLCATGIEAMAEAATVLNETFETNKKITSVSDFAIPYGIKILKGKPKEIYITAEKDSVNGNIKTRINSIFKNKDGVVVGEPTLHYKGSYGFSSDYEKPEIITLPEFQKITHDENIKEILYHPERLFMDEMFETIDDILFFDNTNLITRIKNTKDKKCFSDREDNGFLTDIMTLDGMFQTCGIIELLTTNTLVLPLEISRMKIFAEVSPYNEYICVTKKLEEGPETNSYQIQLLDSEHKVLISIDKMTMIKITKLPEEYKITDKLKVLSMSENQK